MKTVILFLCVFYIQAEAFSAFIGLEGKAWDDAQKRLAELDGKIYEEYSQGLKRIEDTELDFYIKVEKDRAISLYSINETTVIHLNQFDEWIKKAQDQKIDPTKCIGDRKTVQQDLPESTKEEIAKCWSKDEGWNELNAAFRNFTIIPNRVNDLHNKLHNCRENNDNCIKNVMKEIEEGFKIIPGDIELYEKEVHDILKSDLIASYENCIKVNLEKLKATDEQLTSKAVQCIKDLINK